MNDLARLRWRCRRGTREMDILLESYLDDRYLMLSEEDKQTFEQLLNESDVDILGWVTGRKRPEHSRYDGIICSLQSMVKT